VVAGSGTLAMEIAVFNTTEPGDRALVVHTGYFSARMAQMLGRRGVDVESVISRPSVRYLPFPRSRVRSSVPRRGNGPSRRCS